MPSPIQSRALTMCPAEPVDLDCTVLIDKGGTGYGPWTVVGSVSSPDALELASYDPKGCYNVQCTTSDGIDSTHINWTGSFTTNKATGKFKSWKSPYFLSGYANGSGCTKVISARRGNGSNRIALSWRILG